MFRKILFTILCLFVLPGSAFATDYFLDLSHDQANGGDGTTMQTDGGADDAFKTFAEAYASIGVGDVCWIRRITNVAQIASIVFTQDASPVAPAIWIGWPRDARVINCDWENGSTAVSNVDDNDITWSTVCGRWITGPDGFDYLITAITDTATFVIDRPYAGTTAANEDVTIKADELPQGISEPTDTDSWSADADGLALVDFNDGNLYLYDSVRYNQFWNMEFKDSTYADGIIYHATGNASVFNGCLFSQSTQNDPLIYTTTGNVNFNRCIFKGFGGTNSNVEVKLKSSTKMTNSAIYGMGDYGLWLFDTNLNVLENVNIGVEVANANEDIYFYGSGNTQMRDVKLGGTNGDVEFYLYSAERGTIISANHNKVLGAWKQYNWVSTISEKVAVTGTNANKKLSDNVIKITPETVSTYQFQQIENMSKVFESRKTYDAGTYNIKLWIYNDTGNTLNDTTFSDDILMRCRAEAANYGDATTEYVSMPWTYSDEIDILDAADADDWDYLQCDSVVVDVSGSRIYCEVLVSTYDAEANVILIDPQTVNP